MTFSHTTLALASGFLSTFGFMPYAYGIYRGTIKPHMFTWLIWIVVTGLVFVVQFAKGGGPGAWATAVITVMCAIAFIASLFRGEKSRTYFDWICLVLAIIAIPLWWLSGTPRFSVILMTSIEALAFGPTVRKTLTDPYSESVTYYTMCILKYALAALSLDVWTFDTALYPVATCGMAFAFTTMILILRYRKSVSGSRRPD